MGGVDHGFLVIGLASGRCSCWACLPGVWGTEGGEGGS